MRGTYKPNLVILCRFVVNILSGKQIILDGRMDSISILPYTLWPVIKGSMTGARVTQVTQFEIYEIQGAVREFQDFHACIRKL